MAFCTSSVPPRFALRSTWIPVASICCASNSASTTCSVKNFEVMTNCSREEEWHALEFHATNKRIAQTKRFISCTSSRDPQTAFQQTEKKVCEQRQQRGRYCACQDDGVADHRSSAKNECAETSCANGSGNRCNPDGDNRGGANSGKNKTAGQRKTDAKKNLIFGHAHGFCRLQNRW